MSRESNLTHLHNAIVAGGGTAQMEQFLRSIMSAESNGDRYAKNPKSSATGLFQFISSTWEAYGGGDIHDPATQCRNVVKLAKDNAKSLSAQLGREPNAGELYLAHFAGVAGAKEVLAADPSKSIRSILSPKAISANAGIEFRGKKFGQFTAGDLEAWTSWKMGVDMDARIAYERAPTHTEEENEQERKIRSDILRGAGMDDKVVEALQPLILSVGFLVKIIEMFNKASPANEVPIDVPSVYKDYATQTTGLAPVLTQQAPVETSPAAPLPAATTQQQKPAAAPAATVTPGK